MEIGESVRAFTAEEISHVGKPCISGVVHNLAYAGKWKKAQTSAWKNPR
jgi:hypothetical protein